MRKSIIASLEDIQPPGIGNTKKSNETEVVIYATIGDPEGLKQCASFEHHVQLEAKFNTGQKCRVRKIVDDKNQVSYVHTIKLKDKSQSDAASIAETSVENNIDVDETFFNTFMKVAERKIVKTRYNFISGKVEMAYRLDDGEVSTVTLPSVNYEIDVFEKQKESGGPLKCKIDVEVDAIMDFLKKSHPEVKDIVLNLKVTHLPLQLTDVIPGHTSDPALKEKISEIWEQNVEIINTPQ